MTKILLDKKTLLVFRLIVGFIFIYASLDKIQHPWSFYTAIDNYRLMPSLVNQYAAVFLPWLELICGSALILGIYVKSASKIIAGMLFLFILAILSALIRGLDINCGCYGLDETDSPLTTLKLIEDLILFLMILAIAFRHQPFWSLDCLKGNKWKTA